MVSHHNIVSPQMVSLPNGDTRGGPPLPVPKQRHWSEASGQIRRNFTFLNTSDKYCGILKSSHH